MSCYVFQTNYSFPSIKKRIFIFIKKKKKVLNLYILLARQTRINVVSFFCLSSILLYSFFPSTLSVAKLDEKRHAYKSTDVTKSDRLVFLRVRLELEPPEYYFNSKRTFMISTNK